MQDIFIKILTSEGHWWSEAASDWNLFRNPAPCHWSTTDQWSDHLSACVNARGKVIL